MAKTIVSNYLSLSLSRAKESLFTSICGFDKFLVLFAFCSSVRMCVRVFNFFWGGENRDDFRG